MARIAFAWELGGEYGHVMACAALARGLAMRGHHIGFFFRELRQLAVLPEAQAYDAYQAPRSVREGLNAPSPVSFADILLGCGYGDAKELSGLIGGWRSLLRHWRPDLMVADFAPTALLAARGMGFRVVTYGNGFFIPPDASPLPAFRFDMEAPAEHLARSDAAALASANTALARFGLPALPRLADLFHSDEDFLCTFPELDHYGTRKASGYWGPRMRFDRGAEVAWPAGGGKRVFVYVKTNLPQLDALIDALAASPHRVIAYIPDLDDARRARLAGRSRVVSPRPVKLDSALKQCDLMVCNGGEIATGALMYGVPSLCFPAHYEQYTTARRLRQLDAGGWIGPAGVLADVQRGLDQLTRDPRFGATARAFAQRYRAYSASEQRRRIIRRIEELLAPPKAILAPKPTARDPEP
jgi:UDP:flavonoid glycosyltransferase YjiC (YdhE family)